MTRPRNIPIPLFLLFTLLALAGQVGGAASVKADDAPPFELRFPQETHVTRFGNDWGDRRSGGRGHSGTDLMAPKMTQVYAVDGGIVDTIGTSVRAGRYVLIRHDDGWTSMYVHLNNDNPGTDDGRAPWSLTITSAVEEGAYVAAGQLIGWVGDSGNAEWAVSHTHFELALDGREINPYPFLEEAWERDHQLYMLRLHYLSHDQAFQIV